MMTEVNKITQTLMEDDGEQLVTLVSEALEQGRPAVEILNDDLIAGMDLIGEKMGSGEMFIPEVLLAALHRRVHGAQLLPADRLGRERHVERVLRAARGRDDAGPRVQRGLQSGVKR